MAEKKLSVRVKELRELGDAELNAAIVDNQRAIYQVRRDSLSKPVTNPKATKLAKKEIARIKTIQRQRELEVKK